MLSGTSYIVVSVMFSGLVSDFNVLCANVLNVRSPEPVSTMSTATNVAAGAGGVVRYAPPYHFDEYISRYVPRFDARRFTMISVGQRLTVKMGNKEPETAYA